MKLFRILDPFTLTLITVVLLASFFPVRGDFVPFFENLTTAAIALLFFMHGAKLSREAIIAGGEVLATAFVGNVQHLRAVSDSGRAVCLVETGKCRPDALLRFSLLVHSPRDRAVCNRLHVNGGR